MIFSVRGSIDDGMLVRPVPLPLAQMTNWNYWEAVRRFQRVLEVSGVNAALKSRGIQVRIDFAAPAAPHGTLLGAAYPTPRAAHPTSARAGHAPCAARVYEAHSSRRQGAWSLLLQCPHSLTWLRATPSWAALRARSVDMERMHTRAMRPPARCSCCKHWEFGPAACAGELCNLEGRIPETLEGELCACGRQAAYSATKTGSSWARCAAQISVTPCHSAMRTLPLAPALLSGAGGPLGWPAMNG